MRWQSSAISLIATFGSRSRCARKSSRRSTKSSVGSAAGGIRGAALAVQYRDFAEQVARSQEIQRQPAAVGGAGLDADLAAAHAEQGVAVVAFLEQRLARREHLGVAKPGDALQLVGARDRRTARSSSRMTANSACLLIAMPS